MFESCLNACHLSVNVPFTRRSAVENRARYYVSLTVIPPLSPRQNCEARWSPTDFQRSKSPQELYLLPLCICFCVTVIIYFQLKYLCDVAPFYRCFHLLCLVILQYIALPACLQHKIQNSLCPVFARFWLLSLFVVQLRGPAIRRVWYPL